MSTKNTLRDTSNEGCAPAAGAALNACDQLIEHCRQAHDLLRLADVAINQAADLAAATETTDSQHSLAGRLLAPLERASQQIRAFLSAQNSQAQPREASS